MGKITKKKIGDKAKVTTDNTIKDYINDPYFVKKREIGAAFDPLLYVTRHATN